MGMKALSQGRKVYVRNDVIHIIAKGRQYAPVKNFTQIDVKGEVAVADVTDSSIKITQGEFTEQWVVTNVPNNPRKTKKELHPNVTSLLPVQVHFLKGE